MRNKNILIGLSLFLLFSCDDKSSNFISNKEQLKYNKIACDSIICDTNKIKSLTYVISVNEVIWDLILEDTISREAIKRFDDCLLLERYIESKDRLVSYELIWFFVIFSQKRDERIKSELFRYLSNNKIISQRESTCRECPYYYAKKAYFEIYGVNTYNDIDCTNNGIWHGLPIP